MSAYIACPGCAKRFKAKPELIGRRVKCPGCAESFTAEIEQELTFAPAPLANTSSHVAPPPPPRTKTPRVDDSKTQYYQRVAQRFGLKCILVGTAALGGGTAGARNSSTRLAGQIGQSGGAVLTITGCVLIYLCMSKPGGRALIHIAHWGSRVVKFVAVAFLVFLLLLVGLAFLLARHVSPSSSSIPQSRSFATQRNRPMSPFSPFPPHRGPTAEGTVAQYTTKFGADNFVWVHLDYSEKLSGEPAATMNFIRDAIRDRVDLHDNGWNASDKTADLFFGNVRDIDLIANSLPPNVTDVEIDKAKRRISGKLSPR